MGNTPQRPGSPEVQEAHIRAHKTNCNKSSDDFAVGLSELGVTSISETRARTEWNNMDLDGDFRLKSVKTALDILEITLDTEK